MQPATRQQRTTLEVTSVDLHVNFTTTPKWPHAYFTNRTTTSTTTTTTASTRTTTYLEEGTQPTKKHQRPQRARQSDHQRNTTSSTKNQRSTTFQRNIRHLLHNDDNLEDRPITWPPEELCPQQNKLGRLKKATHGLRSPPSA